MGWNSTQRHGLRDEVYHVPIPSGIEFYLVACFSLWLSPIVSIPNEMEFYQDLMEVQNVIDNRFNSQRDGILQFIDREAKGLLSFQFPTDRLSAKFT